MARGRDASERRDNTELVEAIQTMLEDSLGGKLERSDLARLALELCRRAGPQGPRRLWGGAQAVLDSIMRADELASATTAGIYVVRESELRTYHRWLREGEPFFGDEEPLALLRLDDEGFFHIVHVEPVRFWSQGFGWAWSLEFCSPGTGRRFGAMASLERNRGRGIELRKAIHDANAQAALGDLIETLGVSPDVLETSIDLASARRLERV